MKYIKFLFKCILAASPAIILIAYTLLCPFAYMDEEYPAWKYTMGVVANEEGQDYYETVILGDSGAMSSFVPNLLSDSAVNIAVGGGTSVEMYYFLDEYLSKHEKPKNVLIMFAPFHYWKIDNYDTRTMYFKALSIGQAKDLYKNAKEYDANSVYNKDVFWDELSCRMGLPTKYLPAITASKFIGRYSDNKKAYAELVNNNGYGPFGTLDRCDELSYECSYTSMDYGSDMYLLSAYLQRICTTCQKEGINVILLQPAMSQSSFDNLNPDYLNSYYAYIDMIGQQCAGIKYEKTLRVYPNEYFGDVSHLNARGAEKFSKEIRDTYPEFFE